MRVSLTTDLGSGKERYFFGMFSRNLRKVRNGFPHREFPAKTSKTAGPETLELAFDQSSAVANSQLLNVSKLPERISYFVIKLR